jgi:hypothetical protein
VWHVKEPLLLKAMSAKHMSKFVALSPVMDLTVKHGYREHNYNEFTLTQNSFQKVLKEGQ